MKNLRLFAIWAPSQASQSQNGEDVSSGIGGQEFSSRIQRIQRIHRIQRIQPKWCQELRFRPSPTMRRSLRMT